MKNDGNLKKENEKSKKSENSSKNSKDNLKDTDKKSETKLLKKLSDESLDGLNKKLERKSNQQQEVSLEIEENIVKPKTEIIENNSEKLTMKIEDPIETKLEGPQKTELKLNKSPDKIKSAKVAEKSPNKSMEKLKLELKIERKKSPKRIVKPKVNIFLEDSDEVDEFEKITTEVKSRWSSPETFRPVAEVPKIVPAPIVEFKMLDPDIPVVVESPERSPVIPSTLSHNLFEPLATMEKSPTPSPPPQPTKVRNVCSFLSDIASGSIFSGLGFGTGLYEDDSNNVGLKNNFKMKTENLLPEVKRFERKVMPDTEKIMEPDTTAGKLDHKAPEKIPSDNSDTDDSDTDTSSSDSDSDDTTSESEESSEDSSDDDVPSFTRGFGRFDASSMPMVTQIKPTTASATPATQTAVVSRFQSQQVKAPSLITSISKHALYTPPVVQTLPTVTTPFAVGAFQFPIPFKIYSLRDVSNSEVGFPSPVPSITTPSTPSSDKAEKDEKSTEKVLEKDRRDRKRSRSPSRERDRKRLKDDRRKSPSRRRSTSPSKKRHVDDRNRQADDRKDSRRRDSSHSSYSSRTSHASR